LEKSQSLRRLGAPRSCEARIDCPRSHTTLQGMQERQCRHVLPDALNCPFPNIFATLRRACPYPDSTDRRKHGDLAAETPITRLA